MTKKLKHITALLLLMIFPISAIGMSVSIHKCKHSGSFHISFNDGSCQKQHYSDCCQTTSKIRRNEHSAKMTIPKIHSVKKSLGSCCSSKKAKKKEFSSNCCKKSSIPAVQQNDVSTNENSQSPTHTGYNLKSLKTSCCSNSNFDYKIKVSYITFHDCKKLNNLTLISFNNFKTTNLTSLKQNTSFIKKIQYPLKEPITNIISFIHYSSILGEDSDFHSPILFC